MQTQEQSELEFKPMAHFNYTILVCILARNMASSRLWNNQIPFVIWDLRCGWKKILSIMTEVASYSSNTATIWLLPKIWEGTGKVAMRRHLKVVLIPFIAGTNDSPKMKPLVYRQGHLPPRHSIQQVCYHMGKRAFMWKARSFNGYGSYNFLKPPGLFAVLKNQIRLNMI